LVVSKETLYAPYQRFAVVGKTGSGKTFFTVVLACLLIPADDPDWQVWWLDSKHDPKDAAMLRKWGFGKKGSSRKHIRLEGAYPAYDAQRYAQLALDRGNVLLVADEYKHISISARRAGPGLEGVHLRGRSLNVGLVSQTQEPVEVPRQHLSQCAHVFLFDLSYPADQKYARSLFPAYERPRDVHGFYHAYIDGGAVWRYYPHVKAWHDAVMQATNGERKVG
jgi:energy-coupling factor transporter ATP-binding protein EcfA2